MTKIAIEAKHVKNQPTSRARDQDQKQARKQTLMDAGWTLFMQHGQMPSVAQVVQAAGLAKGTFYIYFNTKEELFLELMNDAMGEFFLVLEDTVQRKDIDVTGYVDVFVSKFHKDHKLIKLGSLLAGVLEQNSEEEAVKKFKLMLIQRLKDAGELIHKRFPVLDEKRATRLILRGYSVLLGVAQIIPSSPAQARLMEDPALELLVLDFQEEARAILTALWTSAFITLPIPNVP